MEQKNESIVVGTSLTRVQFSYLRITATFLNWADALRCTEQEICRHHIFTLMVGSKVTGKESRIFNSSFIS